MQFHSVGAVKTNKLRQNALSVLYLFDDTVDRASIKNRVDLMNNTPYCRGTSWGLSGNKLKTTALSGIKNNKYYLAHTSDANGLYRSNTSWQDWYIYLNSVDGKSQDVHAYRYATIELGSGTGSIADLTANFFGSTVGKTYDPESTAFGKRMYFIPPAISSSLRASDTGGVKIVPKFPNNEKKTFYKTESSSWINWNWRYTLQFSCGAYLPSTNVLLTQTNLTTWDISKQYGGGNSMSAVLPQFYTTDLPGILFLGTQVEDVSWRTGSNSSVSYNDNVSSTFGTVLTSEPLYVNMQTPTEDSPACVLRFGAIALGDLNSYSLLLLSIGDSDTDDIKQSGTNVAEMADLTISDVVANYVYAPTKILI